MANAKKIIVSIPTFRRPQGLRAVLDSLAKLKGVSPHILVVDNEGPNGAGLKLVKDLKKTGYRWPITAIPEPARGISQVRNRILAHGFDEMKADFIAMVDDDEEVTATWLKELLSMQQQTGADVVGGIMKPIFNKDAPKWVHNLGIYQTGRKRVSGRVDMVESTANVLFAKSVLAYGCRFNEFFSNIGGGDKDFFTRLKIAGAKFAFSSNAVTMEYFDKSRTTYKWAIKRAFRVGAGHTLINKINGLPYRSIQLSALLKLAFSWVLLPLLITPYYMKAINFVSLNLGKVLGGCNVVVREYEQTHGS